MSEQTPAELLNQVCDRESFVAFVWALAEERERAAEIEKNNPDVYIVDGALGWMNGDIPSFLGACLYNLDGTDAASDEVPTWRLFAEVLYDGKIIE